MKIVMALGILIASMVGLGATFWADGCTTIPPRHWLSPLEIEFRLKESGLRLRSMRTDENRCFSIVVSGKNGSTRTIIVNPADGSIIKDEPQA